MYRTLGVLAKFGAWGCWGWVAYSRQWLWLIPSLIPYFLFTSFGHLIDPEQRSEKDPKKNENVEGSQSHNSSSNGSAH